MEHRDNSDLDPASGSPNSDDAFARGAGQTSAEDDLVQDPGVSEQVSSLSRQLGEQQDKYLRLAAEYDNFRKRTARERAESTSRAQAELVKHLLDGLDDLARFAHVDPATVDAGTVVQGVDMVEKKFLKTLTGAGLEIVDPVNQSFDPALHEAVSTEPALSPEDDHVVSRVYQLGYLFNGQLLRPARVVVKQWNG
ncbi:MAG TPA: nucleotide exchange factor GrpE [Gemmatimonadaceae bacterium]|nr:nucleotide exchange factor GrpE [Gemmatimonadaceae bacterium]